MLKPDVERLSDVDLAIELTRKEPDFERAREQNQQRAEELANMGRSFQNVLEWEFCWYWGFCTPGLILGAVALLRQDPSPTAAVIREGLQGHVCRGGAHPHSVDAVRARQGSRSRPGSRG